MTQLRLDALHATLARGADASITLAIGPQRVSAEHFRHDPPTPQELERAIDRIEDELQRAAAWAAGGGELVASGTNWRPPGVSGRAPAALTLDEVEALFQRLASASLGDPSAARDLPAGREAAATLLVLRELMHHLGFGSLRFVDA